jgi:pimeloyl-ACP methyl ester carboxylesterase
MNFLRNNKTLYLVFIAALILSVIYPCSIWAAKKQSGPVEIQFQAKDGFNLVGELDIPKGKSIKNKANLVIFLHSLGRSSLDWKDFPVKVKELDVAVLTFDLRGHRRSIFDKNDKKKYWQNFNHTEFRKYPDDIVAAMDYIRQHYPEIDTKKIAIIASNISANASIVAASKNNKVIQTLILLSPSTSYKGIETRIPMVNYGKHPVLTIVSMKDEFSYQGTLELLKYAQGAKELKAYPNGGNGMDLLKFQPESQTLIINWLKTHFLDVK